MTSERLDRLLPHIPDGETEIYFHPATWQDDTLKKLMPDYEHQAEFQALLRKPL